MADRIFAENVAEMMPAGEDSIRVFCRRCYAQVQAAHSVCAAWQTEEHAAQAEEQAVFHGRTVVLTGSVYARAFLDVFPADKGAAPGLRVAMSARRRPCYRGKDIVPAFYLPGTPQAEREKRKMPKIGVQETEEHVLRLLSILFQSIYRLNGCPKETAIVIRLLALHVRAPAAVTGLGLCRVLIGKTQKELAALLGISVKAYRLREQGRVPLSEEMAAAVCKMAGCDEGLLLADGDIGWNAAEFIWKKLSPDSCRWIAVSVSLFLRMLCGADKGEQ